MYSKTAEYALRAMAQLAAVDGQSISTPALAKLTNVPSNYLAKVLQQLSAAGLVAGRRGVGGGYWIAKPADQVTLEQVIAAVGGGETPSQAAAPEPGQGDVLAALERRLRRARESVHRAFSEVTLAQIVAESGSSNGRAPRTPEGVPVEQGARRG